MTLILKSMTKQLGPNGSDPLVLTFIESLRTLPNILFHCQSVTQHRLHMSPDMIMWSAIHD
jgi:hypothetical protein